MCSAVNNIDMSVLERLKASNHRVGDMGVKLHLSEVKGPVTDKLCRASMLDHLSGQVFLTQYEPVGTLLGPSMPREDAA